MGGAATAYLASKVTPAAVALESTFTSIPDVVQGMPLGFLFSPLIRHRLNSIARIPHIQAPLLIIHSPADRTIPFSHGKKLFEAAHPPKTFVEIKGDHNDGFVLSMDMYLEAWEKFLADIMPRQPV
jgi:fermentation-respiration switch protein FrsA (DUF1100 family)